MLHFSGCRVGLAVLLGLTAGLAREEEALPQIADSQLADGYLLREAVIVASADDGDQVNLAAAELRRYAYLRTGVLPELVAESVAELPADRPAILLRCGAGTELPGAGPDARQNHALYAEGSDPIRQVVHGATPTATLWAAYSLIESWGFGFYLGGDTRPAVQADYRARPVRASYAPVLAVRGNLPWFNFLNSPTTWNPQDYRTFFEQMAKQKVNFIGFHAYDHEPFGGYDINPAGATRGGPLMTTISAHRWWSPPAMATSDFLFGTNQFFDRGEWGCEVGIEDAWTWAPGRAVARQQQMMAEALATARRLGLRTCLGWEVTGNPDDETVRREFRRRLEHTLATYPLDYFWIWQSEGRGVGGEDAGTRVTDEVRHAFADLGAGHNLSEAQRITSFVRLAHETLAELAPDVRLIVSGWGGDAWMRFTSLYPGLDQLVPDDVIFAALDNIDPRLQPSVSDVYGRLRPARQRWPIPWFESDGGFTRTDQTGPQTNVTAFEPLLRDLLAKGCQGALGIHWRTRNVEDVAGYLYRVGWNPGLSAADYFRQYAGDHYGPDAAETMARVHLRLEEFGPQYVGAAGCIECATPFQWFAAPTRAEHVGHKPNSAGHLPDGARFAALRSVSADLAVRGRAGAGRGTPAAAASYSDLAGTIKWLVARAEVGLAIWNDSAPLGRMMREAEQNRRAGRADEAAEQVRAVLAGLQALQGRLGRGFEALATTCRTRGELGMLATANARYGRYYAAFLERCRACAPKVEIPEELFSRRWAGPDVITVLPVPGQVCVGETVAFDAILLRAGDADFGQGFSLELRDPQDTAMPALVLTLNRRGGAYRRAEWACSRPGLWSWRLIRKGDLSETDPAALPNGAVSVLPASIPVVPAWRPAPRTAQIDPVLVLDFESDLGEYGTAVGEVRRGPGRFGQALDTRSGGYLVVGDGAGRTAFTGPFSVAFFARPEPWEQQGEMPVLLSQGDWLGSGYFVQRYHGRLRVGLGGARALDAGDLPAGEWSHVAVVHDGAAAALYINGECAGVLEGPPPGPSGEPLRLGAYRDTEHREHFPFRGLLDEVVFFERALSSAEIGRLARDSAPSGIPGPGPQN